MKSVWGFIAGMLLGSCAAMAVIIVSAIIARLFNIAPEEHVVFWLAVLGIPLLIRVHRRAADATVEPRTPSVE